MPDPISEATTAAALNQTPPTAPEVPRSHGESSQNPHPAAPRPNNTPPSDAPSSPESRQQPPITPSARPSTPPLSVPQSQRLLDNVSRLPAQAQQHPTTRADTDQARQVVADHVQKLENQPGPLSEGQKKELADAKAMLVQAEPRVPAMPDRSTGDAPPADAPSVDAAPADGDLSADDWFLHIHRPGSFDGELYDSNKLDGLEKDLAAHGVTLERDADRFLASIRGGIAAGFQALGPGRGVMNLKSNATVREVLHEMVHFHQFRELGYEKYMALRETGQHEMGVLEWFERHPEIWNRLNGGEQMAEMRNYNTWKDYFNKRKQSYDHEK